MMADSEGADRGERTHVEATAKLFREMRTEALIKEVSQQVPGRQELADEIMHQASSKTDAAGRR